MMSLLFTLSVGFLYLKQQMNIWFKKKVIKLIGTSGIILYLLSAFWLSLAQALLLSLAIPLLPAEYTNLSTNCFVFFPWQKRKKRKKCSVISPNS